jgi:hypothetical protein
MPKADEPPSTKDLYPNLTPEELAEAERNLDAYAELVLRIWERIKNDPAAYEEMLHALKERERKDSP